MKTIALTIVIGATTVGAFANATFVGLGDLPGGAVDSRSNALSRNGQWIVGESQSVTGTTAFRWSLQTGMISMGLLPGGNYSRANAITPDGSVIVGEAGVPGEVRPFRWTSGSGYTTLPKLAGGPNLARAYAISGNGNVIVGTSSSENGEQSVRWVNGQLHAIGFFESGSNALQLAGAVSNDGSKIFGISGIWNYTVAYTWTSQQGMLPTFFQPPAYASISAACTDDGTTVVGYGFVDGVMHAYRRSDNQPIQWLPMLAPGLDNYAHSITADGEYVGGRSAGDACIWDDVHGVRSLRSILLANGATGFVDWHLYSVNGITVVGDEVRIAGTGTNPQGRPEAFYATFPANQQRISGQCILQDFYFMAGQTITIEVRPVGTTSPIATYFASLDAAGRFQVDTQVPLGQYDLAIKASHWLRHTEGNVEMSGNGAAVTCSLINGDVDGDNEVSIGDYSRLSAAFGTGPADPNWDYEADLNGDLGVDIGDFAMLSMNFGSVGND